MIVFRRAGEIIDWQVVFSPVTESRWSHWIPGRWKHVKAYAFSPEAQTWVWFDPNLMRTKLLLLPNNQAGRDITSRAPPPRPARPT